MPGAPVTGDGAASPTEPGTVAQFRAALAAGTLTARQLTGTCRSVVERLNPALRAVITISEQAVAEAGAQDEARAAGGAPGALAGIPVLVKDNIAVRDMPATAGSPALSGVEQGEAFLVAKLREAGAVILGKANLSEWANFRSPHSTSGWSTLGGQTANPHALDRNPSGSSSGSAAAVAAGMAPLAVGTETDGSITCPASVCGIVGIKPTLGLVSRAGIVPVSLAQDTAGPMARSVADAAAMLGVLAGPDPADPVTEAAAGRPGDYTAFLDPGALTGARIGVWRSGARQATPGTVAVLNQAVRLLREAGAEVTDPVELPGVERLERAEFSALLWEFKHDLNAYLAGLGGQHPRSLARLIDYNRQHAGTVLAHFGQGRFERAEATGGDLTNPGYLADRAEATEIARQALGAPLAQYRLDAIVTLTCSPAWKTDLVLGDPDLFLTSGPAAVAGYPAISVPAGDVRGLPCGLSFTGPAWSEPALIALAYAFERIAPPRLVPALTASGGTAGG